MLNYNRIHSAVRRLCRGVAATFTLIGTFALTACSSDDATAPTAPSLTIAVTQQPWQTENINITRSGETLTALQASGFGLYSEGLGISNEQVTWTDTKWTLAHTLIWPKTRPIDFYAYAPYIGEAPEKGITALPTTNDDAITFTQPFPPTAQTDLLYGQYVSTTGDVVNLQFHHALAKLSFTTIANSSTHDMLVSNIKVTGDLYESGKLNLTNGTWSEQTAFSPANQTIQIIPNNKFIYVPAGGENRVRIANFNSDYFFTTEDVASPILIPGRTVTVSYEVFNERMDFEELSDDNFHTWNWTINDVEDVANATMTNSLDGNYVTRIGTAVSAGQEVCGTTTVSYLTYADISAYDKLVVVGTQKLGLRVLMDRKKVGDGGGDEYGGGLTELRSSINDDGYAVFNISSCSRLNAIKVPSGSPSGTVTKILLVKTTHPHTVSGTTVLEKEQEKTFHLKVGVNHEVVIDD